MRAPNLRPGWARVLAAVENDPPPDAIDSLVARIRTVLGGAKVSLSDEKQTQADLADVLTAAAVPFVREHRLSSLPQGAVDFGADIPDFLCGGRVAIEVKLKSARKIAIHRQLARYARHDEVEAVILVTNHAMGLPADIGGKPAYYVSLGRAWL